MLDHFKWLFPICLLIICSFFYEAAYIPGMLRLDSMLYFSIGALLREKYMISEPIRFGFGFAPILFLYTLSPVTTRFYPHPFGSFINIFMGITSFAAIGAAISKYNIRMDNIAKSSFFVFCIHGLYVGEVKKVFCGLEIPELCIYFSIVGITISIATFFFYLFRHKYPRILSILTGMRAI